MWRWLVTKLGLASHDPTPGDFRLGKGTYLGDGVWMQIGSHHGEYGWFECRSGAQVLIVYYSPPVPHPETYTINSEAIGYWYLARELADLNMGRFHGAKLTTIPIREDERVAIVAQLKLAPGAKLIDIAQ